jgi:hypothetical protein
VDLEIGELEFDKSAQIMLKVKSKKLCAQNRLKKYRVWRKTLVIRLIPL